MKIIARIEKLVQIGPDDYRIYPITKIFESNATIDEIHAWAQNNNKGTLMNDIQLTEDT